MSKWKNQAPWGGAHQVHPPGSANAFESWESLLFNHVWIAIIFGQSQICASYAQLINFWKKTLEDHIGVCTDINKRFLFADDFYKHRVYHSWQLVFSKSGRFREIRRISCENMTAFPQLHKTEVFLGFITFVGRFHMKSAGFHLKSARNPPDFKIWAFAWWSSIGLSFERPNSKTDEMHKYPLRRRKNNRKHGRVQPIDILTLWRHFCNHNRDHLTWINAMLRYLRRRFRNSNRNRDRCMWTNPSDSLNSFFNTNNSFLITASLTLTTAFS